MDYLFYLWWSKSTGTKDDYEYTNIKQRTNAEKRIDSPEENDIPPNLHIQFIPTEGGERSVFRRKGTIRSGGERSFQAC